MVFNARMNPVTNTPEQNCSEKKSLRTADTKIQIKSICVQDKFFLLSIIHQGQWETENLSFFELALLHSIKERLS